MQFAFVAFTFFPFGGLTRDMVAIARVLQRAGHQVHCFVAEIRGDVPQDLQVELVAGKGISNHARNAHFARRLIPELRAGQHYDAIVGFNKMPGLDMYYAADSCYIEKALEERHFLYRYNPRARLFIHHERAVFAASATTRILMIAEPQIPVYQHYYHTPAERFTLLPPGISRAYIAPPDQPAQRALMRRQLGISEQSQVLLFVGSGFKTKGLDRAIKAFAAYNHQHNDSVLLVAGQDNRQGFSRLAQNLGVTQALRFLGARDDIPALMFSADLLIHPAYRENTGTVLLEAMLAGLPVVTTEECGYAHYVRDYQMGQVIERPFSQQALDDALQQSFAQNPQQYREKAKAFAAQADIFARDKRAADSIIAFAEQHGVPA